MTLNNKKGPVIDPINVCLSRVCVCHLGVEIEGWRDALYIRPRRAGRSTRSSPRPVASLALYPRTAFELRQSL
jgi:hypothetical protein